MVMQGILFAMQAFAGGLALLDWALFGGHHMEMFLRWLS
jgi:hypothetical protein